jgi:hypothetical protein
VSDKNTGWCVVRGGTDGAEDYALTLLSARLAEETGRPCPVLSAAEAAGTRPARPLFCVGTEASNALFASLPLTRPSGPESYTVSNVPHPFDPSLCAVAILGADPAGVLYGVCDFLHFVADVLAFPPDYRFRRVRPFVSELPRCSFSSAPALPRRGIWTWARCIGDYRGFLDNMARWKLNTLVAWNDTVPENGAEVVRYAHSRGIRVLWGFSWGWGTDADLSDESSLALWRGRVVREYLERWEPLGGDGIYFQTLTETDDQQIGGVPIARLATRWVNAIASDLLALRPELYLEFGLHATSVKTAADELTAVDPRLTITWEDGGAFPFAYSAADIRDTEGTLALTDRMLSLRGPRERAGFVFKGVHSLFWPEFRPTPGPRYRMGEDGEPAAASRAVLALPTVRFEQAHWLKNLPRLTEVVRRAARSGAVTGSVTLLVEEAGFERRRWLPAALFAETLWDPFRDPAETLCVVAASRDADFA